MARLLGKTHAELLTGRPQPLTTREFVAWQAYKAIVIDRKIRAGEDGKELVSW